MSLTQVTPGLGGVGGKQGTEVLPTDPQLSYTQYMLFGTVYPGLLENSDMKLVVVLWRDKDISYSM